MSGFPRLINRTASADGLAGLPELPPLLARLYASRGLCTSAETQLGLDALPAPTMLGLDAAVSALEAAIASRQRLLIVGDFDCDGATSTSLAILGLKALGAAEVDFLVPNRFEYGYGLSPEIVAVAAERRPDLIITVDNGIASIDGVAAAASHGIPVIVTDHHLPGDALPDALAIVNPNQPGCPFPDKSLAGVGVMFYVLLALRARLRDSGHFVDKQAPNLAEFLDLVALGTVADVVPLSHANRILVEQGLRRIRAGRCRPGISALLRVSGREASRLVASDLGFTVGPRLNAAGRLDDMSIGIRCLLSESPSEALNLAAELDDLNRERRSIEQSMKDDAMRALSHLQLDASRVPAGLCLYDPTWHQGVVGILASRIKEQFHRPVIAFAEVDDGEIKGSARSIPGLHMRDTLDLVAKRHPKLLSKFGGHAMAAGLSLAKADFDDFKEAFVDAVAEQLSEEQLEAVVHSDGELSPAELSLDNAELLRNAGPWGQAFPAPLFHGRFSLQQQRIVGERHLKMTLAPLDQPQAIIDAIAFNVDTAQWPDPAVREVELVYKLDSNLWRDRLSLQLLVEHLRPVVAAR
ncbi:MULTISPECIES: single-stranded-DNA-specific exonuclease RecJ [Spongiibacter]|uniref:single-stranded-DNA-specific exonuclease RecJ n=1 Tax=Spongiibacter TaxID=630749 RepID=UPI0023521A6B|nr:MULTISPECIES: single-stranded-DNA-specific exonuclease RecJ [Spongiibacter]